MNFPYPILSYPLHSCLLSFLPSFYQTNNLFPPLHQVAKYTADINSALEDLATNSVASEFNNYLKTASFLPSEGPSAVVAALAGQPQPTTGGPNAFTGLPSSLYGPIVSEYDAIASIARGDLSADPALTTEAPYYIAPGEETSRPKITEVKGSGTNKPSYHSSSGGYATQTGNVGFATVASASGAGAGAASGSLSAPTGTAAGGAPSPITSAKPTGGAVSSLPSRTSLSLGALVVVGCIFAGLL